MLMHRTGRPADALKLLVEFRDRGHPLGRSSAFYENARGLCLYELGRLDEAIDAYRSATKANDGFVDAWINLGNALNHIGSVDEALVAHQRAAELDDTRDLVHYNLAKNFESLGRYEEAVASYRKAVALNPSSPEIQCNLGLALRRLGAYDESLKWIEKGHVLGSARAGWEYPSERWLATAKRWVSIQDRLTVVAGTALPPQSADEMMEFAKCALLTGRPALAVRYVRDAFEESPDRIASPKTDRFMAARAAVMAAADPAMAKRPEADSERSELLADGLAWLQHEFERQVAIVKSDPRKEQDTRLLMRRWLTSPSFSMVRDDDGSGIPEPLRTQWHALWQQIRAQAQVTESGSRP